MKLRSLYACTQFLSHLAKNMRNKIRETNASCLECSKPDGVHFKMISSDVIELRFIESSFSRVSKYRVESNPNFWQHLPNEFEFSSLEFELISNF